MLNKIIKINRIIIVLVYDFCMIPIAWFGAYWLRYNLSIEHLSWLSNSSALFSYVFGIQLLFFWHFGLYRGMWRFASIEDLIRIVKSVVVGSTVIIIVLFLLHKLQYVPRSIFPLYCLLLICFLGLGRFFIRMIKSFKVYKYDSLRALIIGGGGAGENLLRDIIQDGTYYPVAVVDDDLHKLGQEIHQVRVVGTVKDIPNIVRTFKVDIIFIAISNITSQNMRFIVDQCEETKVPFRTLPSLHDLAYGKVNIEALRPVQIEDLLGREEIFFDKKTIEQLITGKTVLITGAGGSIGTELCRQVTMCKPSRIILLEHGEYELYTIEQLLLCEFGNIDIYPILADVADEKTIDLIFKRFSPQVVFHSAAYKHVSLLEHEYNLRSAIINNLIGTYIMAKLSSLNKVDKFILISTDKAVEPISLMGKTKRAAEIICQYCQLQSNTKFIIVRFGNVLASTGSVIPLFTKQIAEGGPVTITDPNVERYFMTISEAVLLILKATSIGVGGEIFVLDMGNPIKIKYLAEQMIKLSGKKIGKDIEFKYVGLKPGEKVQEKLFYENEQLLLTNEPKIMKVAPIMVDVNKIYCLIEELEQADMLGPAQLETLLHKILMN